MHRIDWRVAAAAVCVGAILIVLGVVAFGGNGTDEAVRDDWRRRRLTMARNLVQLLQDVELGSAVRAS